MNTSQKYGLIGVVLGVVSAAASARPLTLVDLLMGGVIVGGIGFVIGKFQENRSKN
jgi:hypothetical protein